MMFRSHAFIGVLVISTYHVQAQDSLANQFIYEKIEKDSLWTLKLLKHRTFVPNDSDSYADFIRLLSFYDLLSFEEVLQGESKLFPYKDFRIQTSRNNKTKWKKGLLPKSQPLISKPPKDWRHFYSMSMPIFSIEQKYAIVEVGINWAQLFGRGYLEIYKRKEDGWVLFKRIPTWMS